MTLLTAEERKGLDTRFNTNRKNELWKKIPRVEYFHNQRFLPCCTGCSVFLFYIPKGLINDWWGTTLNILGSPGALINQRQIESFTGTYDQSYKARGCDLVAPFEAVEYLCKWEGYVDLIDETNKSAFLAVSGMSIKERRTLLFAIRDSLRIQFDDIIMIARAYGVLNTLDKANQMIRFAKFDADK